MFNMLDLRAASPFRLWGDFFCHHFSNKSIAPPTGSKPLGPNVDRIDLQANPEPR
jgi:hypothetical protein